MSDWYYMAAGKQIGPVPLDELRRLASTGSLQETDPVWGSGMSSWDRADSVGELDGAFGRVRRGRADPPPAPRGDRRGEPRSAPAPRSGLGCAWLLHFAVACLALLLSAGAFGLVFFEDRVWPRLRKYDFTTPTAALKADKRIELEGDTRARTQLKERLNRKKTKEILDSIEIRQEEKFGGKVILFVKWTEEGKPRHQTKAFEKNAELNIWVSVSVSELDVLKENPKLASMMESWNRDGTLGTEPHKTKIEEKKGEEKKGEEKKMDKEIDGKKF